MGGSGGGGDGGAGEEGGGGGSGGADGGDGGDGDGGGDGIAATAVALPASFAQRGEVQTVRLQQKRSAASVSHTNRPLLSRLRGMEGSCSISLLSSGSSKLAWRGEPRRDGG